MTNTDILYLIIVYIFHVHLGPIISSFKTQIIAYFNTAAVLKE